MLHLYSQRSKADVGYDQCVFLKKEVFHLFDSIYNSCRYSSWLLCNEYYLTSIRVKRQSNTAGCPLQGERLVTVFWGRNCMRPKRS